MLNKECVVETKKFSEIVIVWVAICSKGVGRIKICTLTIDGVAYCKILKHQVLNAARDHFSGINLAPCIFQDDNAICHRSAFVTQCISDLGIQKLWWPSSSPDMNPVENLWSILSSKLSKYCCTSKIELMENIVNVWHHEIEPSTCQKLVESIPQRVQAL